MLTRHHRSSLRTFSFVLFVMSLIVRQQRVSPKSFVFFIQSAFAFSDTLRRPSAFQGFSRGSTIFPSFKTFATASENEGMGIETKVQKRKKRNNGISSKDKRREFIGKAKAVDRGQWATVYNPGGKDYHSFEAKSGLPDRTKLFTVLGIESSCDDTGGVFLIM